MARSKKMLWQIYLPFIAILLLSLFFISWQAARTLRQVYVHKQIEDLSTRAFLIRELGEDFLTNPQPARVDSLCKTLGKSQNCRFTVILKSGRVIGDTDESPDKMDNHRDRPEIRTAMQGETGVSSRFSYTLNTEMLYVAVPFGTPGASSAAIRVSMPLSGLAHSLHVLYRQIALMAALIALFAALVALFLSRRINKPISELIRGAERFGRGDLNHHLYITEPVELHDLSVAMNSMAEELDNRIRTVTRQRNEIESILGSMVEAILAVDMQDVVIRFNHASANLFHIKTSEAYGKHIHEVTRNTELIDFIRQTQKKSESQEADIHFLEGNCILKAHGTTLNDSDGNRIGALVVMHDITQIKRLETIRKDFVANVSHELKTPVTSIKGFVETLRDDAINDPANAKRFLDILLRHTDRLSKIIDDLLKLSRLESDRFSVAELVEAPVSQIIDDAILICQDAAEKKKIRIEKDFKSDINGLIDPPLLEEALVNLIDNAIKYSDPESQIRVSAAEDSEGINIRVQDWGSGIQRKHLDRIFERFYRVDKARNRDLGGTGLGLSIVKHIAGVHQGEVTVESVLGEGSTFTLHLPKEKASV